ncbi:MAG: glycoside hydrolase family 32 protein [Candidatus Cyclobacteriaceae bacterium M3_2C_046]
MKKIQLVFTAIWFVLMMAGCSSPGPDNKDEQDGAYREPHRLQFHFSPPEQWMNDPNGMVYLDGEYHLFYQHYPDDNVWGPMHWGHAISKDLVHWENMPIALYPDTLGYIFSGSAVADMENTSGFGSEGETPLVAVFTYHDPKKEQAGSDKFQTQGIAYSLDKGRSWTKYEENPVLDNPGIRDYRDPKVFWYEEDQKWVMVLAVKDRVHLYSSPDLKEWKMESEFGTDLGAHGGVWECPDLFPLSDGNTTKWIMLVSINPGGPNGGSATQYFVGDFDGQTFTADHEDIRWLDYGPDNYAGVSWSNVTDRRLFIGWMSNWAYATVVPTYRWRSAMTISRELNLEQVNQQYYVISKPVQEFESIVNEYKNLDEVTIDNNYSLTRQLDFSSSTFKLQLEAEPKDFTIRLSNSLDEYLLIGFNAEKNQFFIDRNQSGKRSFNQQFPQKNEAPRLSADGPIDLVLLVDVGSVELFADGGQVVMSSLFFPNEVYNEISLEAENISMQNIRIGEVERIW